MNKDNHIQIFIGKEYHKKQITKIQEPIYQIMNLQEQYCAIRSLYLSSLNSLSLLEKEILRCLQKKRSGYIQQDLKKGYDRESVVSIEEILELLILSKYKCCYCECPLYIIYTHKKEPRQWTLDRLNNDKGHTPLNCVISCLVCNLQRRRMTHRRFQQGKQIVCQFSKDKFIME